MKTEESRTKNLFCFVEKEKIDKAMEENRQLGSISLSMILAMEGLAKEIEEEEEEPAKAARDIRSFVGFFGAELKSALKNSAFESLVEGLEE